jgi:hypothetical protein
MQSKIGQTKVKKHASLAQQNGFGCAQFAEPGDTAKPNTC